MRRPVTFQNSPDERFAGSFAYLSAVAIWSVSILLLCFGYPDRLSVGILFLTSLATAVLSQRYLSRSFGSLKIGGLGIDYLPVSGGKISFRWQELAQIKVLPGWLWIYDKEGKKVFSYTYGLGKQHSLINLLAQQMPNNESRPTIWPEIAAAGAPAPKRARRKKSGGKATTTDGGSGKKPATDETENPAQPPQTRTQTANRSLRSDELDAPQSKPARAKPRLKQQARA